MQQRSPDVAGLLPSETVADSHGAGLRDLAQCKSTAVAMDTRPGLEWWQVTLNLVVVVVGAGVMALPILPVRGGLVPTTILVFFCGGAMTESGFEMWRGVMAANANASRSQRVNSYEDFSRAAFKIAGEMSIVVMQVFYFIGVAAGFITLIADALVHISGGRQVIWALVLSPVLMLLALLRNIQAITKLMPVAVGGIFALCATVVVKCMLDARLWQEWHGSHEKLHKLWPQTASALGPVSASLVGAFGITANVPSMLCEMQDPSQFPKAFGLAMGIVAFLYLLIMGSAYYAYGEFMRPDLIDSITSFPANEREAFHVSFDKWTGPRAKALENVVSSCLLAKLLVGLPLNLMVIFYSVQTFEFTRAGFPTGAWTNKVMRVAVVAMATLIAIAIPEFGKLYALACSIFSPSLNLVLPIFFSRKIQRDRGMGGAPTCRGAAHGCIMLLALLTTGVGFYQALVDIIDPV